VARFFRSFHKQLYIYPGDLPDGVYIVGPLGLVLLISVLSALTFYKIRWKDVFRRRQRWSGRILWSALHRSAGIWALAFSVVFAITGFWYVVERVISDAGLASAEAMPATAPAVDQASGGQVNLDVAVGQAREAFPELRVETISFPSNPRSPIVLYGPARAWLVRESANHVILNRSTGEVVGKQDAQQLSATERFVQTTDPLHFGTFGGFPKKLLWFVAGLAISASILIGTRLWYLRVQQQRMLGDTSNGFALRAAPAVTLGVLALCTYGSIVNIGESIADNYHLVPIYVWIVVGTFVFVTALITVAWFRALVSPPSFRTRTRPVAVGTN
jgi:uncharacterized iron-regulated membrane protein